MATQHACDCGLELAGCLYPRCPEGEYAQEECDHCEYETDIITGRAHCGMCSHSWYLSSEEIAAEHERIARYHEWEEQERRWDRWRQVRDWFRNLIPRRRRAVALDDDIPF